MNLQPFSSDKVPSLQNGLQRFSGKIWRDKRVSKRTFPILLVLYFLQVFFCVIFPKISGNYDGTFQYNFPIFPLCLCERTMVPRGCNSNSGPGEWPFWYMCTFYVGKEWTWDLEIVWNRRIYWVLVEIVECCKKTFEHVTCKTMNQLVSNPHVASFQVRRWTNKWWNTMQPSDDEKCFVGPLGRH